MGLRLWKEVSAEERIDAEYIQRQPWWKGTLWDLAWLRKMLATGGDELRCGAAIRYSTGGRWRRCWALARAGGLCHIHARMAGLPRPATREELEEALKRIRDRANEGRFGGACVDLREIIALVEEVLP